MEIFQEEISKKIKSAVKAKLIELGIQADNELPDYVMVLVANKKPQKKMEKDLQLFLGESTTTFCSWLVNVLKKLEKVTVNARIKRKGGDESKIGIKKRKLEEALTKQKIDGVFGITSALVKEEQNCSDDVDDERNSADDVDVDKAGAPKSGEEEPQVEGPKSPTDTSSLKVETNHESSNSNAQFCENTTDDLSIELDLPLPPKPPPRRTSSERREQDWREASPIELHFDHQRRSSFSSDDGWEERISTTSAQNKAAEREFADSLALSTDELLEPLKVGSRDAPSESRGSRKRSNERDKFPSKHDRNSNHEAEHSDSSPSSSKRKSHRAFNNKDGWEEGSSEVRRAKRSNDEGWRDSSPSDDPAPKKTRSGIRDAREILQQRKIERANRRSKDDRVEQKKRISSAAVRPQAIENNKRSEATLPSTVVKPKTIKTTSAVALPSCVQVKSVPKPSVRGPIQPNKALLLKAVADAEKSVRLSRDHYKKVDDKPPKSSPDRSSTSREISTRTEGRDNFNEVLPSSIVITLSNSENRQIHDYDWEACQDAEAEPALDIDLTEELPNYGQGNDGDESDVLGEYLPRIHSSKSDEWEGYEEPETETSRPFDRTRLGPPVVAAVKPLLSDSKFEPTSPTKSGVDENAIAKVLVRCKFWPECKQAGQCRFHHPTSSCKKFPKCRFGDSCLYIHPLCKFGMICRATSCPYMHVNTTSGGGAPSSTPATKSQPKITCRFGASCKRPLCPFEHPGLPSRKNLVWTAPSVTLGGKRD